MIFYYGQNFNKCFVRRYENGPLEARLSLRATANVYVLVRHKHKSLYWVYITGGRAANCYVVSNTFTMLTQIVFVRNTMCVFLYRVDYYICIKWQKLALIFYTCRKFNCNPIIWFNWTATLIIRVHDSQCTIC